MNSKLYIIILESHEEVMMQEMWPSFALAN